MELPEVSYARNGDVSLASFAREERGLTPLKGVPGEWRLFTLTPAA